LTSDLHSRFVTLDPRLLTSIYTIRLRGPWQLEPLERYSPNEFGGWKRSTDDLPAAVRAKMPAAWADSFGPDFRGRVRYRRTFQMPTGLDEGQRVWLVIEPPRSSGRINLNGTETGAISPGDPSGRYDITEQLVDSNRLDIVVEHPPLDDAVSPPDDNGTRLPGGLVGEVRLEIEE
jgi:hypothetical protein